MYNMKIVHYNIRSLKDKIHELKIFIATHNPDIITLNETFKIKPSLKIPNYTITQPINNTNKGVAIIHKNNIKVGLLPPIPTTQPTKNLQHSILIHTPTDSIQITTLYCPQKQPSTEILQAIMTRHDKAIMTRHDKAIMTRHDKAIITGDFSSKHEDFGHDTSDISGRTLVDITNQYKYTKLNDNEPTYTNDATGKQDVKDLNFSSPKMTHTFKEFWVDEDLGSDHNTIIATPRPTKEIFIYHKADWQLINNNIENTMKHQHLNHNSHTNEINNYITKPRYFNLACGQNKRECGGPYNFQIIHSAIL